MTEPGHTSNWQVASRGPDDTARIAGLLALVLRTGDLVRLTGDVGAGKSTFARALIRSRAADLALDVPSPTFTLIERYQAGTLAIHHADFYRLEDPLDLDELGLDEALTDGALVVEWPERGAESSSGSVLSVQIDGIEGQAGHRAFTFTGDAAWSDRLDRMQRMHLFLAATRWADASIVFLQGDASPRRYGRLVRGGATAILMDAPAQPDGPTVRDGKSYSVLAHLAEDIVPFVALAQVLGDAGVHVPRVIERDLEGGLLVIEDLGDLTFARAIADGHDAEALYTAACDMLLDLAQAMPGGPPDAVTVAPGVRHVMPVFDRTALLIEAELLLEWYLPAATGDAASAGTVARFRDAWAPMLADLAVHRDWVLRDVHSPNLMVIPHGAKTRQPPAIGVLDFQDAMRGHAAYDLVSLLQDARRDIPPEMEARLLDRYCERRATWQDTFDPAAFRCAYAVLGAQRASKITGIFVRLAHRDGKHGYLQHLPRIWGYLERNLRHPTLTDLRRWYDDVLPQKLRQPERIATSRNKARTQRR